MEPVCLRAEKCVFVMIDLQETLAPAMSGIEPVLYEAERLLKSAAALKIPVLATEQYPKGLGATVPPLRELLGSAAALGKTSFSCFGAPDFAAALARCGRRTAVVFGIESHICVFSTAMELKERGYDVAVVEEACTSRNRRHHELAMRNLLAAGVAVLPVETVVYQLLGRSGTPEFKALLPLFK